MATKKQIGSAQGKAFASTFKALYDDAQNSVEEALLKGALRVERDAKINAPVDTGRLRASISSRLSNSNKNDIYAEVGTNVAYAKYMEGAETFEKAMETEFGTSKKRARPFLFPAYTQNKEKIKKDIAAALKKSLKLG
jgi:HK97 gp10 family phage protein